MIQDFNDDAIINLLVTVSKLSIWDYKKAKKNIRSCRNVSERTCAKCRQFPRCRRVIEEVEQYFHSDLFAAAFPGIDPEWVLESIK